MSSSRWFPQLRGLTAMDDSSRILPEEGVEVEEDLALDDRRLPLAFHCPRHTEEIVGISDADTHNWRFRDRMKTVSVALVMCLNVGVDPPDVIKTRPCARVECWIDPNTMDPPRALESIGNALQKQYGRWQSRARYRQSLDPTIDEVRRLSTGLRRNARDERVLFHYNGHGVPKPTVNGEIWVFNRTYTQYIPLSLYDLQTWVGSPSIFVYDCSNAGIIVEFAEQHEREHSQGKTGRGHSRGKTQNTKPAATASSSSTTSGQAAAGDAAAAAAAAATTTTAASSFKNCIQLAACSANQLLPMNPELPADLFTSCLTTPIKMALRWFVMQNQGKLATGVSVEMLDKIPGQVSDRRTMLGELNWIFTAITDTIAWNTIPRGLFQKLFRQDLLLASLFRNFLLAERVMRSYDCTPVSQPSLPSTHQHPMWLAWDLAVDTSLAQLPSILDNGTAYKPSAFFEDQLTAFEMWLKYGNESRPPPEQLPIVLQVLLSQAHRLRALDLLGRFLDLGPWAVYLALSVGIFPYVLRLLRSSARELRSLLVSIWAKILAVDTAYQVDLVRESSHRYFMIVLQDDCMMPSHRMLAAFILASVVHNYRQGQKEAEAGNLICIALERMYDKEPVLRQWLAITVGRVWDKYELARWKGVRNNAHEKLYVLLRDPVPEVRASAVFALGTFINSCEKRTEHANNLDHSIALHLVNTVGEDGSPLVRQELVVALQYVVAAFEPNFIIVCRQIIEEEEQRAAVSAQHQTVVPSSSSSSKALQHSASIAALDLPGQQQHSGGNLSANKTSDSLSASMISFRQSVISFRQSVRGTYTKLWFSLVLLTSDPCPQVSSMAQTLADHLRQKASGNDRRKPPINAFSPKPSKPPKRLLSPKSSSSPPKRMLSPGSRPRKIRSSSRAFTVSPIAEEPPDDGCEHPEPTLLPAADGGRKTVSFRRASGSGRHPSGRHSGPPAAAPPPPAVRGATPARTNLTTEFLPWSCKHFTKQLMKHECLDCSCDHESGRRWRKEWLYNRNHDVRLEAEGHQETVRKGLFKVDKGSPVVRMPSGTPASVICFHPYNPRVVVAGHARINMWDIERGEQLSSPPELEVSAGKVRITSLDYINAHVDALLLVASDDGSLRLFKDHEEEEAGGEDSGAEDNSGSRTSRWKPRTTHRLVSSWNGLRELAGYSYRGGLTPVTSGLPVHTAWSQFDMTLGVGGDARYIRLWDAEKELKKADLNTGSDSYVSCLTFSSYYAAASNSGVFAAGFGDGTVKLFDVRTNNAVATTSAAVNDLRGPVLDCRLQETSLSGSSGQQTIVAGSRDGEVRVVETRKMSSGKAGTVLASSSLGHPVGTLAFHQRAPLLAAWNSQNQTVSVHHLKKNANNSSSSNSNNSDHQFTLSSAQVNAVKSHDEGVLGLRLGADGCLAFHPHLAQFAIGSKDGAISIKSIRKTV